MKKVYLVVLFVLFATSAFAQMPQDSQRDKAQAGMPGQMGPGMMGGQMQQMMEQMMPMCQKMMQQMVLGPNMMTNETLGTMKDILRIQQKMIMGSTDSEKAQMLQEISRLMERIDRQMSMLQQMMGGQTVPPSGRPPAPEKK